MVAKAKEGDIGAARLLIDRVIPPLKAKEVAVQLTGGFEGSLSKQGEGIIQDMVNGNVSASEAASLLQALAAQAKVVEIDDLENRISKLEEQSNVS